MNAITNMNNYLKSTQADYDNIMHSVIGNNKQWYEDKLLDLQSQILNNRNKYMNDIDNYLNHSYPHNYSKQSLVKNNYNTRFTQLTNKSFEDIDELNNAFNKAQQVHINDPNHDTLFMAGDFLQPQRSYIISKDQSMFNIVNEYDQARNDLNNDLRLLTPIKKMHFTNDNLTDHFISLEGDVAKSNGEISISRAKKYLNDLTSIASTQINNAKSAVTNANNYLKSIQTDSNNIIHSNAGDNVNWYQNKLFTLNNQFNSHFDKYDLGINDFDNLKLTYKGIIPNSNFFKDLYDYRNHVSDLRTKLEQDSSYIWNSYQKAQQLRVNDPEHDTLSFGYGLINNSASGGIDLHKPKNDIDAMVEYKNAKNELAINSQFITPIEKMHFTNDNLTDHFENVEGNKAIALGKNNIANINKYINSIKPIVEPIIDNQKAQAFNTKEIKMETDVKWPSNPNALKQSLNNAQSGINALTNYLKNKPFLNKTSKDLLEENLSNYKDLENHLKSPQNYSKNAYYQKTWDDQTNTLSKLTDPVEKAQLKNITNDFMNNGIGFQGAFPGVWDSSQDFNYDAKTYLHAAQNYNYAHTLYEETNKMVSQIEQNQKTASDPYFRKMEGGMLNAYHSSPSMSFQNSSIEDSLSKPLLTDKLIRDDLELDAINEPKNRDAIANYFEKGHHEKDFWEVTDMLREAVKDGNVSFEQMGDLISSDRNYQGHNSTANEAVDHLDKTALIYRDTQESIEMSNKTHTPVKITQQLEDNLAQGDLSRAGLENEIMLQQRVGHNQPIQKPPKEIENAPDAFNVSTMSKANQQIIHNYELHQYNVANATKSRHQTIQSSSTQHHEHNQDVNNHIEHMHH